MIGDSKRITSVNMNYINLEAYKAGSVRINVIFGRVLVTIVTVEKQ
jgi:hypothetical protein